MLLKRIVAFAVSVVFLFTSTGAFADMSSYMSNIMSRFGNLEPKVYHLQQRGYFVGGTLHIPPMGQTIQPLSITLPSIKNNSCGGIDVTMGGFSYLNFKYLVQKLQSIIQAAPALAFEIAVKVLSEKLGGVMNYLESISDAVNGLNFNSCEAMNGIVTTVSSAISKAVKESAKGGVNQQSSGGGDFFGSLVSNAASNIWDAAKNYLNSMIDKFKGAVSNTKHAIEEAGAMAPDGLLNEAAEDLGGLPSDFVNMIRYYTGDVVVVNKNSSDNSTPGYSYQVLAPCGENASPEGFVRDVSQGVFRELTFEQLQNGECEGTEVYGNGLVEQVTNAMNDIYNALIGAGSVDQQDVNLIEISPVPIYSFLKDAVILGKGYSDELIQQLAKPVAMAIASEFVSFYLRQVRAAASKVEARMKIRSSSKVLKPIDDYIKRLIMLNNIVYNLELKYMQKSAAVYGNFMQRYKDLQNAVEKMASQLNLRESLRFQNRGGF